MLVCLLALSVGQAAAQRCLPGMQAVEMRGGMAPSAGYFAGLGVTTHARAATDGCSVRNTSTGSMITGRSPCRLRSLPLKGAIISNYYPMQGKPSSFMRECPHWPDTKR